MTPRDPIQVVEFAGAPEKIRWSASFGDWVLGDPLGVGPTPEAAIEDLHWAAGDEE